MRRLSLWALALAIVAGTASLDSRHRTAYPVLGLGAPAHALLLKGAFKRIKRGLGRAARRVGRGLKKGAKTVGKGLKKGAKTIGKGIKKGAKGESCF